MVNTGKTVITIKTANKVKSVQKGFSIKSINNGQKRLKAVITGQKRAIQSKAVKEVRQMVENGQRRSVMLEHGQNGQKWSRNGKYGIKNGPKLSKRLKTVNTLKNSQYALKTVKNRQPWSKTF